MENNEENRRDLAERVVDEWDMKTLVQQAIDTLSNSYFVNDELFQSDWKNSAGVD